MLKSRLALMKAMQEARPTRMVVRMPAARSCHSPVETDDEAGKEAADEPETDVGPVWIERHEASREEASLERDPIRFESI